jgi:hypothetical protein
MGNPVQPLTPEQEAKQMAQAGKEGYVKRVLIGFDQFVNTVAGGHPDETISARSGRAATEGKVWGKAMAGFLNLFQSNHSAKAQAGDLERADIVEGLETSDGTLPKK